MYIYGEYEEVAVRGELIKYNEISASVIQRFIITYLSTEFASVVASLPPGRLGASEKGHHGGTRGGGVSPERREGQTAKQILRASAERAALSEPAVEVARRRPEPLHRPQWVERLS